MAFALAWAALVSDLTGEKVLSSLSSHTAGDHMHRDAVGIEYILQRMYSTISESQQKRLERPTAL